MGVGQPRHVASDPGTGAMNGDWHTYVEAAELLGISPNAARHRAIRGRWQGLWETRSCFPSQPCPTGTFLWNDARGVVGTQGQHSGHRYQDAPRAAVLTSHFEVAAGRRSAPSAQWFILGANVWVSEQVWHRGKNPSIGLSNSMPAEARSSRWRFWKGTGVSLKPWGTRR